MAAGFVGGLLVLPTLSHASCSWFAGKDTLSRMGDGAAPEVQIAAGDAQAIAMNAQDCGVWVLGRTELRHYDASGALALNVGLQSIDSRLTVATRLAVDPYDGSVWLGGDKILAHASSTGAALAKPAYNGVLREMAVALDQSVWVLGDKQLSHFSALGTALAPIDLKVAAPSETKKLAIDSIGASAWAATNKTLVQVSAGQAAPVVVRQSNAIAAITIEPATGRLWVADGTNVHVYDAAATLVRTVSFTALGLAKPDNVLFDPVAKVLWFWNKDGVGRLSADGALLGFLAMQPAAALLAVPAFSVQPVITLIEPPQDALTNNPLRPISIGYDAQCNGNPCGFPASYFASYALSATLNGQDIGANFVFDASALRASYVPAARYPEGANTLQAQARDSNGRLSNAITGRFTVDTIPPTITITAPTNGALTNKPAQTITGSISEPATLVINGAAASVSTSGTFTTSITLQEGLNTIALTAVDRAGNTGQAQLQVTLDTIPPTITVTSPANGSITNKAQQVITGTVSEPATLTVNGVPTTVSGTGTFSASVTLQEGANRIVLVATDRATNQGQAQLDVTLDTVPPTITVASPVNGAVTNKAQQVVSGSVSEPATLIINGAAVSVSNSGTFTTSLTLQEGANSILLAATDRATNVGQTRINVTLDTTPPAVPIVGAITVSTPTNGSVVVTGAAGSVEAGSAVTITDTKSGTTVTTLSSATGSFTANIAATGGDSLNVTATDAANNQSAPASLAVPGGLPPDPATIATPIDRTVATQLGANVAFLYTGANPVQTGVAANVIDSKRVAVLRGKALTRDGQPLPGAKITILNHPEFGQTLSRADGMFDMAVNGGGPLAVNYDLAGYLPAQRLVDTPWTNYVHVPDVALITLDAKVTSVDLSATVPQVAQSTPVTDPDGTRKVSMIFLPGTTAVLAMPDGSKRPIGTLNVRATEYTVGPNGQKAMPAALPPTSHYTYAVELSADEATAAGATGVTFSKPVPMYVDNFVGFAVGTTAPVGYYDRQKAAWVASENGRVLSVLAIENGLAVLDINGAGQPATATELGFLQISDAERAQLANLYAAGASLWRVRLAHFSAYDINWLLHMPDALPSGCDANGNCTGPEVTEDCDTCEQAGSIIDVQNLALGEQVPIVGTPFTLNYRSNRQPGYLAKSTLRIVLTNATVPAGLVSVELTVDVAGQHFEKSFPPVPNQEYIFTWDGKDAYGRPVVGAQSAEARVGYVFRTPYEVTATDASQLYFTPLWGVVRPEFREGPLGRASVVLWRGFGGLLQPPNRPDPQGLGGWTINAQHTLDIANGRLLLGDGRMREAVPAAIDKMVQPFPPFEIAATGYPRLAVDPAGGVIMSGEDIRRLAPDGSVTSVSGGTTVIEMALSPSGVVYGTIWVGANGRQAIVRVEADGTRTPIAGYPTTLPLPAGVARTPAMNETIYGPIRLLVDREGNVYYWQQSFSCFINKVTTAGTIVRVVGNGDCSSSGDGGSALNASVQRAFRIGGMVLDREGNLYFADSITVRKVTPDGTISRVAGSFFSNSPLDNAPATNIWLGTEARTEGTFSSRIQPISDIAIDPDGNLLIAAFNRILKVGKDGIGHLILNATPDHCTLGAGSAALTYCPGGLLSMTVDPAGRIYVLDSLKPATDFFRSALLKKIESTPGVASAEMFVPTPDATLIDVFDLAGKHKRAQDAKLKSSVYEFSYGTNGILASVKDAAGNTTVIERDGSGQPTAIVSPDGLRTVLQVGPSGLLERIANPAGDAFQLAYGSGGLITSLKRPNGKESQFTYGERGILAADQDAAGGIKRLDRTLTNNFGGSLVTVTSPEGRTTQYFGDKKFVAADGTQTIVNGPNSRSPSSFVGSADGTTVQVIRSPDPRFGAAAPVDSLTVTSVPSGLSRTETSTRVITFSSQNILDLATQVDTSTVNGKSYTRSFDATSRQYTSTTPLNRSAAVTVDAQGRPVLVKIAGVEGVGYTYDVRGRLIGLVQGSGTSARTATLAYDAQGRLSTVTDAAAGVTAFAYDAAGRVIRKTLPDGRVIDFAYDANGNVTSITPPSRPRHAFSYNAVDLEQQYAPPPVTGVANVATQYSYNLDKQLTAIARPDGRTVQFGYDAGGRISSITVAEGTTSYGYTPAKGTLAGITTSGGVSLAYAYDGFLQLAETWGGPLSGTVSRSYNNNFDLASLNVVGTTYTFSYDDDRLLTKAGSLAIGRDATTGFVKTTQLGNVTTALDYTTFGELKQLQASQGGTTMFARSYVYDVLGRVVQVAEQVQGQSDSFGYGYDPAGRLTTVTKNGAPLTTYQYDSNGNRTSDGTNVAVYDDQDRLLQYGNATYTYTENGELKTKKVGAQQTAYGYDTAGNLRSVVLPDGTSIEYVIDGRNRRIGKKVNGQLTQGLLYLNQLSPVAELDAAGNVKARFVYGTQSNVPDYMEKGGKSYRIVSDHLGSVRMVVDTATGEIVQRIDYDAFGYVLQDTNPGFQPFGFAGGLLDQDTKLIRFGARDYDASIGRWTAKDPIGFSGLDTSLYLYVGSNPVNRIDPLGLQVIVVTGTKRPRIIDADLPVGVGPNQSTDPGWSWPKLIPDSWIDKIKQWCKSEGAEPAPPADPPPKPYTDEELRQRDYVPWDDLPNGSPYGIPSDPRVPPGWVKVPGGRGRDWSIGPRR